MIKKLILNIGSFGYVYKGNYRGADVAIKKLKKQNLTKKQLDEFTQEASTMVGLRHPSISSFFPCSTLPLPLFLLFPRATAHFDG